jgi:hypothetical protein
MPKWVAHIQGFGLSVEGDTEEEATANAKFYLRIPDVFTITVEPVGYHSAAVPGRLRDLALSPRTTNILERAGITTVEQLLKLSAHDLLEIQDFGPRSGHELRDKVPGFRTRPVEAQRLAGRLEAGGYPAMAVSLRLQQILATVRKYGSYADALPAIRRHDVWVREIDELKGKGMLSEDGEVTARGTAAIGEAQSF